MTRPDDSVFLHHILDAITRIEEYIKNVDEGYFLTNYLIQDGVIRQLEIIGEAVKGLSEALRNKYIQIPWQDIAGMRDKLIHHYFGVDIDKVWFTVQNDIPELKTEVLIIFKNLNGGMKNK